MPASDLDLHSSLPEMGIMQLQNNRSPYYYNLMNGHAYNSFRTLDEYSGYKEAFKRTVVEHDALFREQVSELHRIYRTQKDLMDNVKRQEQELYKFSYQNRIYQPRLLSSSISTIHTENIKPCIDFLKQDCYIPRKEYCIRNDTDMVNLKLKRHHSQLLDLRLPADMYIVAGDNTDMMRKEGIANPFCGAEYESNVICDTKNEVDVQLTLGRREYTNQPYWKKLDFVNGYKDCSVSNQFEGGDPLTTRSGINPRNCFHNQHMNEEIYPNWNGNADTRWPSFNHGNADTRLPSFNHGNDTDENRYNFLTPNFSNDLCQNQTKQLDSKKNNTHNIPLYDTEETSTLNCEPDQNNPSLFDLNDPILTNSHSHTPLSFSPCSEIASSSSPLLSSPKRKVPKVTLIPIVVQALPCFPPSENIQRKKQKNASPKETIVDLNEEFSREVDLHDLDTLNTLAAENLLIFSQGVPPNMSMLHWFAETVLSENSDIVIDESNEVEVEVEVDMFESLTLNLEEKTPDEYLPTEQELEYKEEKTHEGRKRREKKKDFRKEILPSLLSLSKHELSEDLHAFNCIMKAMGENWDSKLTKKKLGKRKAGKQKNLATDLKVDISKMETLMWGRSSKRGPRLRAREFSNFTIDI